MRLFQLREKNLIKTNQKITDNWIKKNKPDTIIDTSALVGGIQQIQEQQN